MARLDIAVVHRPRLVFDVRDWFRTEFGSGAEYELPSGSGNIVRAIVRVANGLTVTAKPSKIRDPRWPFSDPVELVLRATPSGMWAFFGRVRTPGGPLRRLLLQGTKCDLLLTAPGYQPVLFEDVTIPAQDAEPPTLNAVMLPGQAYPFPNGPLPNQNAVPTLLSGWLRQADGTGLVGAKVRVLNEPRVLPATIDEDGNWTLVLDLPRPPGGAFPTLGSSIELSFEIERQVVAGPTVTFDKAKHNRVPQTSVRGRVKDNDGRAVNNATVSVLPFAGTTITRRDGSWVFYRGVEVNPTGSQAVTIQVVTPDRPTATISHVVEFGEVNEVPEINV